MNRIERLLSREIGLCVRSIGASAVNSAVQARVQACKLSTTEQYTTHLERDPSERRFLVEEIVVSETWFFRDEDVFRTLTRHALGPFRAARPNGVLQVLSIPCATGEEAYSVAIALLESGLLPNHFRVRGVDVSQRALSRAARARYGRNSFRGSTADPYQHYFEAVDGDREVIETARRAVSFEQGNILDPHPAWAKGSFDVVLCRNLLIYLDREARVRALENLHNWLSDDGLLFAGHAEALESIDARFQRLEGTLHYAYRKRGSAAVSHSRSTKSRTPAPERARGQARLPATPLRTTQESNANTKPQVAKVPPTASGPKPNREKTAPLLEASPSLEAATKLADRGKLEQAARSCERLIAEVGATPEAYCLLGIIRRAASELARAEECFSRALYLDPSHHESLVHLALLHEQRGDLPQAERIRRRAQRAQGKRAAK